MDYPKTEEEYDKWVKTAKIRKNGQELPIKREIETVEKEKKEAQKIKDSEFDYDQWRKDNDIKPSLED